MPSKRPIQAFYIPKDTPRRTISQKSTHSVLSTSSPILPISPSFNLVEELYPYDSFSYPTSGRTRNLSNLSYGLSSLDSSSKLSSRDSYFSKVSFKDEEETKKDNRRRWLPIIIALIIAACLIAVVILLAITLTRKGKEIEVESIFMRLGRL